MNTGVLQTPVSGKGGKAKKTSRSVKSNKSGTQASGSNAGEFGLECSVFTFYLHGRLLLTCLSVLNLIYSFNCNERKNGSYCNVV